MLNLSYGCFRASSIWSIIVDDIKTDKDTKDKVPLELERGEMLIGKMACELSKETGCIH